MNLSNDYKIVGIAAEQSNYLVDKGIYSNHAELFFDSCLIGLFEDKEKEIITNEVKDKSITRTFLSERNNFRSLLKSFLMLDRKFQGEPLTIKEIFTHEKESGSTTPRIDLNSRANYGINFIYEKFSKEGAVEDIDFIRIIQDDLKNVSEIDEYYKAFDFDDEEDLEDLMGY